MASVSITGNIGRDPEMRTAGQSQVLSFSVADNEFIPSKTGESPAQWFNVEVWGKQAERLVNRLGKGQKVAVHGQLCQRPYEGKNGKGISIEIKQARVIELTKLEQSEPAADPFAASPAIPF